MVFCWKKAAPKPILRLVITIIVIAVLLDLGYMGRTPISRNFYKAKRLLKIEGHNVLWQKDPVPTTREKAVKNKNFTDTADCEEAHKAHRGFLIKYHRSHSNRSDCMAACDMKSNCHGSTLDSTNICWLHFKIVPKAIYDAPNHFLYTKKCKETLQTLRRLKKNPTVPPPPPSPPSSTLTGHECELDATTQEGYLLNAARRSRNGHFLYIRNCTGCILENGAQIGYLLPGSGKRMSTDECFANCEKNKRCQGATSAVWGGCLFHSAIVPEARHTKAGFVLYIKQCKVCEFKNKGQRGYHLKGSPFPSNKMACVDTCKQREACKAATLDINGNCWLHTAVVVSARVTVDGHFHYIKDCEDCDIDKTVKKAYELKGSGFRTTKSDCFNTCDQNYKCMGATFDIENFCWPHSEIVSEAHKRKFEHSLYVKHCKAEGDWSFTRKVECPNFTLIAEKNYKRKKLALDCSDETSESYGSFIYTSARSSEDVFTIPFKSKCLNAAIERNGNCTDERLIPKVVHYSFFKHPEFNYPCFLSFMSALRFIKPCMIVVHGDILPNGTYWNHLVSTFPNIIHMTRPMPEKIGENKLAYATHASDIFRIEAILYYGGIYLDGDQIVLKNVDHLRNFKHVQGFESDQYLTSAFMLGTRNNSFLQLWHKTYYTDYRNTWAYNAMYLPAKLAKKNPGLIHTMGGKFTDPGPETGIVYNKNFNWSRNYGIHLYSFTYDVLTTQIIRTLNTTVGAVGRHILYGNKELCSS